MPAGHPPVRLSAMRAHRVVIVMVLLTSLLAALAGAYAQWAHQMKLAVPWPRTVALIGATLVGFGWATAGGALAWLRPRNRVGWVMLIMGALTQFSLSEEALALVGSFRPSDPSTGAGWSAGVMLSLVVGFGLYCLIGLLPAFYPTGRLPGAHWVWPCLVVVAGAALMQWQWLCLAMAREDLSPWGGTGGWSWLPGVVLAAGVFAVWMLSVVRVLRAVFPERLQLMWLFGAVVITVAAQFLGTSTAALFIQMVCLYALPVAVAVGMVRHRLLGIENILRGALVYGVMTAAIVAVQVTLATAAGIGTSGVALPAVVAAVLVAIGLNPVRIRVQRVVDHVLRGPEPIHAVSDLGAVVASSDEQDLLEEMLAGVRDAVRAPWVCLRAQDGTLVAAVGNHTTGAAGEPAFSAVLTVSGHHLGVLEVAGRHRGVGYFAREELVLEAMTSQVAVVVRALELAEELGRERDAVLRAAMGERQRLRRDLHDGLGPSLTGVRLGVEAISDALRTGDDRRAEGITSVLRDEMATAVTEMRRILADLRPTVLSEEGLVGALQRRVASLASPICVEVRVPTPLPRLTQQLENAAYLVATEALNNVIKHSKATTATVHVGMGDGMLLLRVVDDGRGFVSGAHEGMGMDSMRERARALGGEVDVTTTPDGTTVALVLPLTGSHR